MSVDTCLGCGNETEVDNEGFCQQCRDQDDGDSSNQRLANCINCGMEAYVNAQGYCENCYQELNQE